MLRKIASIITIMVILSLTGCSNSNKALTLKDFELSDNTTSKNISIGSSSEDFVKAYNGNYANVMYGNNNKSEKADINKIDYTHFCYVYLPTIFIDNKPVNIDDFIKKNNISIGLDSWFVENSEYLEKHSVIYKCLVFTFEDGNIIYIQSSEKNYND